MCELDVGDVSVSCDEMSMHASGVYVLFYYDVDTYIHVLYMTQDHAQAAAVGTAPIVTTAPVLVDHAPGTMILEIVSVSGVYYLFPSVCW